MICFQKLRLIVETQVLKKVAKLLMMSKPVIVKMPSATPTVLHL